MNPATQKAFAALVTILYRDRIIAEAQVEELSAHLRATDEPSLVMLAQILDADKSEVSMRFV
jgi:hypothetical protein